MAKLPTTFFALTLILVAAGVLMACSSQDLSHASGRELIQLLLEPGTRACAYQELCLRSVPATSEDRNQFTKTHRNPEVIRCPQRAAKEPIYVVLSDFLSHIGGESTEPNRDRTDPLARRNQLLIDTFAADGKKINPFVENDNVLEGIMMDMNQDGFVERATDLRYGVEGFKQAQVFRIGRMFETEELFFSVLYNWGDQDDWDYSFSDRDNDGFIEIDFGPLTEHGLIPKVTFHWDPSLNSFVPPLTGIGNHLFLLDAYQTNCSSVQELRSKLAPFPPDADALQEWDRVKYRRGETTEKEKAEQVISTPYHYSSLKPASNEQIMDFMARGRPSLDLELESSPRRAVPASFWTLPYKEAALQLAEANRSVNHRKNFSIKMGEADIRPLPDSFGISLFERGGHWDRQLSFYVRGNPENSYLAFASRSLPSYLEPRDQFVYEPLCTDFRLCKISYSDARRIAETIRSLQQITTTANANPSTESFKPVSTGDGMAVLQLLPETGTVPLTFSGWVGGSVSERWVGNFGDEELLGLVEEIVSNSLTERTDGCWSKYEKASCSDKEPDLTGHFLDSFSVNQDQLSFQIVEEAVRTTGDLSIIGLAPRLKEMQSKLGPEPQQTGDCDVGEDQRRLEDERNQLQHNISPENALSNFQEIDKKEEEISTLYDREFQIEGGAIPECALADLRKGVALSLQQIEARKNPPLLVDWVRSRKPGWQWALGQLRNANPGLFSQTLKDWFPKAEVTEKPQMLHLLYQADHEGAVRIAAEINEKDNTELFLTAFSILADEGKIPDSDKRLQAVIHIVLDPNAEFYERENAFGCLIPKKDPSRFKNAAVDQALLQLLKMRPKDWGDYSGVGNAATALYARTGIRYFPEILSALESGDLNGFSQILSTFEAMWPQLSGSQRHSLVEAIRSLFKQTNGMVNENVWAAWTLDLRDLKGELENSATGQSSDVEDDACYSWQSETKTFSGRCHLSRQLVTIWNEPDAATRVKLLLALYIQAPYEFYENPESQRAGRMKKLKEDIQSDISALKAEEREDVRQFLNWTEQKHPFSKYETDCQQQRDQLVRFVSSALRNGRKTHLEMRGDIS